LHQVEVGPRFASQVQPQISRQLPVVVALDMASVALVVAEQLQAEQVVAGRHNLPVE
jgi:hypothetical protein